MSDPKAVWLKETFKLSVPEGAGRRGNGAQANGATAGADAAEDGTATADKYSATEELAQASARVGAEASDEEATDDEAYTASLPQQTADADATAPDNGADAADPYVATLPVQPAAAVTTAPAGRPATADTEEDDEDPGPEYQEPPSAEDALSRDDAAAFKQMGELLDATNRIVGRRRALEAKQPSIAAELRSIAETWETITNDVNDERAAGTKIDEKTVKAVTAIGETIGRTAQTLQEPPEMPRGVSAINGVESSNQAGALLQAFKASVAALTELARTQSGIEEEAQRLRALVARIDARKIPRLKQMKEKCERALEPGWTLALPVGEIKGAAQSKKRPSPEVWDDDAEVQGVEEDEDRKLPGAGPAPAEPPLSEAETTDRSEEDKAEFKKFIDQAPSAMIRDIRDQRAILIEQWQERLGNGGADKRQTEKWVDEMIAYAEAQLPEKEKREADDAKAARQQERDAYATLKRQAPKGRLAAAKDLKKIVDEMNKLFDSYQKLKAGREQIRTELRGGAQRIVLALRQAAKKREQDKATATAKAEIPAEIVATLARVEGTYRKIGAGAFHLVNANDEDLAPGLLGLLNRRYKLGLSAEETADAAAIARQAAVLLPNGDSPDRETKEWRSIVFEQGDQCFAASAKLDPIRGLFDKFDVAENAALEKQRKRIGQILDAGQLDAFNIPANVLMSLGASK